MLFGRPEIIVLSLLEKIRKEPCPKFDKLESVVHFALSVRNVCSMIVVCKLDAYLHNPTLLHELETRLPSQLKLNWAVRKKAMADESIQ